MIPPAYFPPDEAYALKHNQMLRDRVQRHGEIIRDIGNTCWVTSELSEDGSACSVSHRTKYAVERGFRIFDQIRVSRGNAYSVRQPMITNPGDSAPRCSERIR